MTVLADSKPHTDAAIAAIQDLVTTRASQVLVDRGRQPDGSGWQGEPGEQTFRPYVVVYPYPGTPDGSVADPVEYLDYRAQATCVAASSTGAENVADLVRAAWVNVPLPVSGRSSYRGQVIVDNPVTRDDAESPPVHYAIIRVEWRTQAV